jgi:hypothetical protein
MLACLKLAFLTRTKGKLKTYRITCASFDNVIFNLALPFERGVWVISALNQALKKANMHGQNCRVD